MSALAVRAPMTARRVLATQAWPAAPVFAFASLVRAHQQFTTTLAPASSPAASSSSSLSLPSLSSLWPAETLAGLRELLPPWLLAAPKRRTTHSAKRMKASNKGLKEKNNLVACPSCGSPKLAHHLCLECHTSFRREIHAEAKEARAGGQPSVDVA